MKISFARVRIELKKNDMQAVFIHIPKTAGSSIHEFCQRNNINIIKHLARYPEFVWYRDRHDLEDYFSFTFVREPVSRCISAFNYLNNKALKQVLIEDAESYIYRYNGDFISFVKNEISKGDVLNQIHFIPQYKWICSNEGIIVVDKVFKYEYLSTSIIKLSNLFGDKNFKLAHANKSAKLYVDYKELKKVIPIIHEVYKEDYSMFGYQM